MRLTDLNRFAVLALLKDADGYLKLAEVEVGPGPAFLTNVVNLRSGYRDLTRRGMPLIMTDDEQTAFQSKLDRLRAKLRFLASLSSSPSTSESVIPVGIPDPLAPRCAQLIPARAHGPRTSGFHAVAKCICRYTLAKHMFFT
jgi:hypothetical protein